MSNENFILKIPLNPNELALATDTQLKFEQLFDKSISLEELFKYGLFFLNNTNNQKIAILESYETTTTTNKSKNKAKNNTSKTKPQAKDQQKTFGTFNKTNKGKTVREVSI
jgi:hypothetical protein